MHRDQCLRNVKPQKTIKEDLGFLQERFCNSEQCPMGTTLTLQSKSYPQSKLSTEKKRKE